MLELESVFDTQSEVVPWLVKGKLTPLNENGKLQQILLPEAVV